MPGEREMLDSFLRSLREDRLESLISKALGIAESQRVRATKAMADSLCELVRTVWNAMTLAGEAGSLLKIEEELTSAIEKGKDEWEEKLPLFRVTEYSIDGGGEKYYRQVPGVDRDFWDRAEILTISAIEEYAAGSRDEDQFRRRMFAEDATQGFAFIDVCRKRYDAVLMNPPFGEPSVNTLEYLRRSYSILSDNLYCGFLSRALVLLSPGGSCGAITDRSFLTKQAYEPLRRAFVDGIGPQIVADLGWDVLDANVETCVVICGQRKARSLFTTVGGDGDEKAEALLQRTTEVRRWVSEELSTFASFPFCSFAYSMPEWMRRGYRDPRNRFETSVARVARGMAGANADHLYRVVFEVPSEQIGWDKRWVLLQKGSPYSPYYFGPEQLLLSEGRLFKSVLSYEAGRVTGRNDYGSSGLAFGKRTDFMYAYVMQPGQVFSVEGQAVFPLCHAIFWQTLAIINSSAFQCLVNQICGQHKYHGYVNAVHLKAQTDSRLHQSKQEDLAAIV